jgi:EAL and modified HD-GYP domain-containing signal transduction protein
MDVFLARQPIFDRSQEVVAYELLYRDNHINAANIDDPDRATTEVFLNTFMEIGMDRVVGAHRAFINMTRPFLVGERELPFSHGNITLEVLEDIEPDAELIDALRRLSVEGFQIALDDFVLTDRTRPLLEVADIVKLDIAQLSFAQVQEHVALLRDLDVQLLAEKVETREEFDSCVELGFDLFQGYFFCKPSVLHGRKSSPSRIAALELMAQVNNPDVEFDELATIIAKDATLAYKLLRFINSAYFHLPRKIESLRHALTLLGQKNIRMWMNMLALSQLEEERHELMVTSLVRGRLCELAAVDLGREAEAEKYFLAGLFSLIDAVLDRPMDEIIDSLSLADDIEQGVLRRTGPVGEVLKLSLHCERGDWATMNPLGLKGEQISDRCLQAIEWAEEMSRAMGASH